ncbi:hypothetical protein [Cellulomonas sp. URHD0024]|uniref:hypothetical protein n=1 Tax=Cellulomonas sp. URHD0024 TaxID=1302620 RepID=UPI0003FD9D7C|nr:hypothetical protein [Cellulomonas sp. URHD0024]
MNRDLQNALHELADRVESSHVETTRGAGLPLPTITARARRNRHRRTLVSLVGAAAAVVLVGGAAYAVLPDEQQANPPAVSPTLRTPTPSPTTSTAAVVLPTGNPALPFGACGSLAATAPEAPVDPDYSIEVTSPSTVDAGGGLTVTARVETPLQNGVHVVGAAPGAGPTFAVTKDGVVVAGGDLYDGTRTDLVSFEGVQGPLPVYLGRISLEVCDAGNSAVSTGRPLPGGAYELHSLVQLTPIGVDPSIVEDGTVEDLVAHGDAQPVTAVGPAIPFTIFGDAQAMSARPGSIPVGTGIFGDRLMPEPLTCGDALPGPSDPGTVAGLSLDVEPSTLSVLAGEPLPYAAGLTNRGAARAGTDLQHPPYFLVADGGTIVGSTRSDAASARTRADLGTRSTLDLSDSAVLTRCGTAGNDPAPLARGTYTVVPVVDVAVDLFVDGVHHSTSVSVTDLPVQVTIS